MTSPRGNRNGSYGRRPHPQRPLEHHLAQRSRPAGSYGRTAPPYPYGPAAPSYPYGRQAAPQSPGQMRPPTRIPSGSSDMRRYLAVALDCYLCLLMAGLLTRPYVEPSEAGRAVVLSVLPALAFSFANQVLLTAVIRASAGKLIMGVRVIGLPGAGRPGIGLLMLRWLYGLGRLPLQPLQWLRSVCARPSWRADEPLWSGGGGELYEELAGLRQVRRSDLLAYRAAVAGRAV